MEGLVKIAAEEKKNSTKVFNYLKENYPEDCIGWAKEVDWKLEEVSLADIQMARRPGGAREQDKVKGIAQAVRDGKPMDPVVLVKLPDGRIKIADGYHRTLGFDHADKEKIKAWTAEVSENKGPWDKEMHEKKLNVGKKASEMELGLAKLAKKPLDLGLAGIEKEASLLGLLGGAAAMHVAPNLLMKGVKSTETGQKGLAGTFSAGVEMGRTKRKMHPNIKSFMEYGLGPESTVDYNLGKKLGGRISDMDLERQERFLGKAKGMFNSHIKNNLNEEAQAEINKVPILNSVKHYFDGHGENKVKDMLVRSSVPEDQAVNWKNHAGNLAMLGGAGAINHELLLQPVLSGVRKKLAKSELGAKIFEKNFTAGHEGKPLSKVKEAAIDMAVSPSVLDSYRIGKAMNKNLSDDVNQAIKENVDIKDTYQTLLAPKA